MSSEYFLQQLSISWRSHHPPMQCQQLNSNVPTWTHEGYFADVLDFFSIAEIETLTQTNLGRKGFTLPLISRSQFVTEGTQGRSSGLRPGGRGWSTDLGGMLLIGLLLFRVLSFFIILFSCVFLSNFCAFRTIKLNHIWSPSTICTHRASHSRFHAFCHRG